MESPIEIAQDADSEACRPLPIGGIPQSLPEAGAFRGRLEAVVGSWQFGAIDDRYVHSEILQLVQHSFNFLTIIPKELKGSIS